MFQASGTTRLCFIKPILYTRVDQSGKGRFPHSWELIFPGKFSWNTSRSVNPSDPKHSKLHHKFACANAYKLLSDDFLRCGAKKLKAVQLGLIQRTEPEASISTPNTLLLMPYLNTPSKKYVDWSNLFQSTLPNVPSIHMWWLENKPINDSPITGNCYYQSNWIIFEYKKNYSLFNGMKCYSSIAKWFTYSLEKNKLAYI